MRRLTAATTATAERWLSDTDRALARLIDEHGPCPLHRRRPDSFNILGWSIINQQLSTRAAQTIAGRVLLLTGERRLSAAGIARVTPAALRAAGLSRAKTRALKNLASEVRAGRLRFRSLAQRPDDEVTGRLVELPGIGAWTAQMYLMFALRRADVFSPADIGLQRAAQSIYGLPERPRGDVFERLAERWRPYRTVACWYLWRLVD